MDLEQRKEELLNLALKDNHFNNATSYWVINNNHTDTLINKISDKKTKIICTSLLNREYLNGNEQFISVLNHFIYFFESELAPLNYKKVFISALLENKNIPFLLSKNYIGNNDFINYYNFNMKRLCVENMYENIKLIYDRHNEFFKKLKITKTMSLKNEKNVDILFNFLKEIIWCKNYNNYESRVLFYSLGDDIKKASKGKNKSLKDDIYINYYETHYIHWSNLIKNYNKYIDSVKIILN